MRLLGAWPGYAKWPDPPKTPYEIFLDRRYNHAYCTNLRNADPVPIVKASVRSCWFICRFGMQSYAEVANWPESQVRMAMQSLGYWIEKEAPKTKAGPS